MFIESKDVDSMRYAFICVFNLNCLKCCYSNYIISNSNLDLIDINDNVIKFYLFL